MPYSDLRILTVHAHPDDESSKGAATIARYKAGGAETVLVCATGGEEGDILNPALDREEVTSDLKAWRKGELDEAARIIGYDEVIMLGYRDSGMLDAEANAHPESFWQAPVDQAVDRLVAILRQKRPHVMVTYSDDQMGYRHPDHLRVNDISVPAFELVADRSYKPELGEPWEVLKMYYTTWSLARIAALHAKFEELGIESPYSEDWFTRPSQDDRITTRVEIGKYHQVRSAALLAHATQVDPESPFWFGLPDEASRDAYPWDDYILARSLVPSSTPEDDLFAGVRDHFENADSGEVIVLTDGLA